jgi:hypothetical protein
LGSKFGEYIAAIYFFMIFFLFYFNKIKHVKKLLNYFLISGFLILIITFFHRNVLYHKLNVFNQYLYQRIAQQGQLWWGTYDKKLNGNLKEALAELTYKSEYKYNMDIQNQNGIWKIMLLNAPKEVVETKFENFSRYTASTRASLNYYFGLLGNCIFHILVAKLIKKLFDFLLIETKNTVTTIVKILIFYKMLRMTLFFIFMSDFHIFLEINGIIALISFVLFQVIIKIQRAIL